MNTKILLGMAIATFALTGCMGLEDILRNYNSDSQPPETSKPPEIPQPFIVTRCTDYASNVRLDPPIYPPLVTGYGSVDSFALWSDGKLVLNYYLPDAQDNKSYNVNTDFTHVKLGVCAAGTTSEFVRVGTNNTAGPLDSKIMSFSSCSYPINPITKLLHFKANYKIESEEGYYQSDTNDIQHGTIEFDCSAWQSQDEYGNALPTK